MDKLEYDKLVKLGWNGEGVGWYSDDSRGQAIYRQYNPYAKTGTHNYTRNSDENNTLVKAGWEDEEEAWYGIFPRLQVFQMHKEVYSNFSNTFFIYDHQGWFSNTQGLCFFNARTCKQLETEAWTAGDSYMKVNDIPEGELFIAIVLPEPGDYKVAVYTKDGYPLGEFLVRNVIDYDQAENEFIDKLIKEQTNSSMDSIEKMDAICTYLRPKMKYTRTYSSDGGHCFYADDFGIPWFKSLTGNSYEPPQYLSLIASQIGGFTDIHNCYWDYEQGTSGWYAWHHYVRVAGKDKSGTKRTRYYFICSSENNVIPYKNYSEIPKRSLSDPIRIKNDYKTLTYYGYINRKSFEGYNQEQRKKLIVEQSLFQGGTWS